MNEIISLFIRKVRSCPDNIKKEIIIELLYRDSIFKNHPAELTLKTHMFDLFVKFYIFFRGKEKFREYALKKFETDPTMLNDLFETILIEILIGKHTRLIQDFIKCLHDTGWKFEDVPVIENPVANVPV